MGARLEQLRALHIHPQILQVSNCFLGAQTVLRPSGGYDAAHIYTVTDSVHPDRNCVLLQMKLSHIHPGIRESDEGQGLLLYTDV